MDIVVIGVGNPYRCDDGVGPAVVELVRAAGLPAVRVAQSTGEATDLMDLWQGAELAVVVDAVRVPHPEPGRAHRVEVADLDPPGAPAASSHGLGLGGTVALARVLDRLPGRLVVYAVEVVRVTHGEGLSPAVAAAVPGIAQRVVAEVTTFVGPDPLCAAAQRAEDIGALDRF